MPGRKGESSTLKAGFTDEGLLRHEFFVNGEYRDALRMAIFQPDYLARLKTRQQA